MIRRSFLKSLLGAAVAVPTAARARLDRPPRKPLLLQRSPLAGFQFHDGEVLWPDLSPGDPLDLVREPSNPHDPRAVAVHWRGRMLGYVPQTDNCTVAQLLDRGESARARVLELHDAPNPWNRITLEISI